MASPGREPGVEVYRGYAAGGEPSTGQRTRGEAVQVHVAARRLGPELDQPEGVGDERDADPADGRRGGAADELRGDEDVELVGRPGVEERAEDAGPTLIEFFTTSINSSAFTPAAEFGEHRID